MNRQRELIYKQRDQVLDGDNVKDEITKDDAPIRRRYC